MESTKLVNTKTIDPEIQKARASRLKAIYLQKKNQLSLTQKTLASQIGMNQSAVAQYLNGYIPLNYEAMAKFAKGLQCSILDIEPDDSYFKSTFIVGKQLVSVVGTASGSLPNYSTIEISKGMKSSVAVELDQDVPFEVDGNFAILSPGAFPDRNMFALRRRGVEAGFQLCKVEGGFANYLNAKRWLFVFSPDGHPIPLTRDKISFIAPVSGFVRIDDT